MCLDLSAIVGAQMKYRRGLELETRRRSFCRTGTVGGRAKPAVPSSPSHFIVNGLQGIDRVSIRVSHSS